MNTMIDLYCRMAMLMYRTTTGGDTMVKLYTNKISDLHAHTDFSDGDVSVIDSIQIRKLNIPGIQEIGVSDHYLAIKDKVKWAAYIEAIKGCQELFEREGVAVQVGVEFIIFDLMADIEDVPYEDLDYIILENYESIRHVDEYKRMICALKERFTGRIIMAHPNFGQMLGTLGEAEFTELVRYLRDEQIPLEMNVSSSFWFEDGYDPRQHFSEPSKLMRLLNQEDALMSIGTDAHSYELRLFSRYETAVSLFGDGETY